MCTAAVAGGPYPLDARPEARTQPKHVPGAVRAHLGGGFHGRLHSRGRQAAGCGCGGAEVARQAACKVPGAAQEHGAQRPQPPLQTELAQQHTAEVERALSVLPSATCSDERCDSAQSRGEGRSATTLCQVQQVWRSLAKHASCIGP